MTSLIVEQIRRSATKRYEEQAQRKKYYDQQVAKLSKSDLNSNLDIRNIKNSKQLKDQKNYYDVTRAKEELEQLLQQNGLFFIKDETYQFIKKITGRELDSFTVRETGKWLSDLIEAIKIHFNIKK